MPESDSTEPVLYSSPISAGFPSPADDYVEKRLDLNELLIKHREATFFLRVSGDSMRGAGIHHGDLIVVDRSLAARHQKIVVAVLDGEFVVKRLLRKSAQEKVWLVAENIDYKPIEVTPEMDFQIWGVVTWVLHAL